MTGPVALLNSTGEVLNLIDLGRAMGLVNFGQASILRSVEGKTLRSPTHTWPYPRYVMLHDYRHVHIEPMDSSSKAKFKKVLARDRNNCIYCGKKADTIDHIFPESRGGENIWSNLAAACKKCNNQKANRTPEEAGMPLLWNPGAPSSHQYPELQREVYAWFAEQAGAA